MSLLHVQMILFGVAMLASGVSLYCAHRAFKCAGTTLWRGLFK